MQYAVSPLGHSTPVQGYPDPPTQVNVWSLSIIPMPSTVALTTHIMIVSWQSIAVISLVPEADSACISAPPSSAALILHIWPSSVPR